MPPIPEMIEFLAQPPVPKKCIISVQKLVVVSNSLIISFMHSSLMFISFVFSEKWFAHSRFNLLTAVASIIATVKWFHLFMYGDVVSFGIRPPGKRLRTGGMAAKISAVCQHLVDYRSSP